MKDYQRAAARILFAHHAQKRLEKMVNRQRVLVTGGSGFIGANFILEATRRGSYEILNLDTSQPKFEADHVAYRCCDLLDRAKTDRCFADFQPSEVIHLAGRTDMFGSNIGDYSANHVGTQNVISAICQISSVRKSVFTSSQFVVGPGAVPRSDEEFRPHTIYGESKVLSEKAIREADLQCSWTIVRPTNIWGRWHPRYPSEFWRVVRQGRYFHPGGRRVVRCYGYVGNVVDQIMSILNLNDDRLNRRSIYVGDQPVDIYLWANAFSLQLTGRPVRVMPRPLLKGLARMGDVVIGCGGKFPIYSSRFRSMTEDYLTPMDETFAMLGSPRFSLESGVRETVEWLRTESPFWRD